MKNQTFADAIKNAIDVCMKKDKNVIVVGLGVNDPKGIFGTTDGLLKKHGPKRIFEMPISENAVTGVLIGAAINGHRPIMTHQRVEFALLSLDQIINQASKLHYMSAGKLKVPIVIRIIIGQGWGNGAQHSQSLISLFANIPGLKVVAPFSSYDAKGMMISSIYDNNPIIFFEHRWLHNLKGKFPNKIYKVPLGKAKVLKKGTDLSIISYSYSLIECLKCYELFKKHNLKIEIIDLRSINPLDVQTILKSVRKTKKAIIVDNGWSKFGVSSEIISMINEKNFKKEKIILSRIGFHDSPAPSTRSLVKYYYPNAFKIGKKINNIFNLSINLDELKPAMYDIPDDKFTGPF